MAFNLNPGRSPFQQTGRDIPSAFLQVKNAISGATTKRVKNASGEVFDKTITSTTIPGTPGTSETVIKGKKATLGTVGKPDKYTGPKTSNEKWKKFLDSPKGKDYTKMTKGEPGTPGTPDKIIPGTPGTPSVTTVKESQKPVMGAEYDVQTSRGYIGSNAGKKEVKGTVTSSNVASNNYVTGTNNYNKSINDKYGNAEEGSAKANGLSGASLKIRNEKSEERKNLLTRETKVTETPGNIGTVRKSAKAKDVEKQKANNAANSKNSTVKNNMAPTFQLKNKNKKAVTKKSSKKY